MASTESEPETRAGNQQAMLASQRNKDANKTAVKTGYFPLGYKDGFTQWVSGQP